MLDGWDVNKRIRIDLPVVTEYISDIPIRINMQKAPSAERNAMGTELWDKHLKVAFEFNSSGMQCYAEVIVHISASEAMSIYDVRVPYLTPGPAGFIFIYFDSGMPDNVDFVGVHGSTPAQLVWDSTLYQHVFTFSRFTNRVIDSVTGLNLCTDSKINYNDPYDYNNGYVIDRTYGGYPFYLNLRKPGVLMVNGHVTNQDTMTENDVTRVLSFSGLDVNSTIFFVELYHNQQTMFNSLADRTNNYQYDFFPGHPSYVLTNDSNLECRRDDNGDNYLRSFASSDIQPMTAPDAIGCEYNLVSSEIISGNTLRRNSYYGFSGNAYLNELTVDTSVAEIVSPFRVGNTGGTVSDGMGIDMPCFNGTLYSIRFLKNKPSAAYSRVIASCMNPLTGFLIYELDSTTGVPSGGSGEESGDVLVSSFGLGGYVTPESNVRMASLVPSFGLNSTVEREEITSGKINSDFVLAVAVHGDSSGRQVKIDTISFKLNTEVTADPMTMATPDVRFVLGSTASIEPYSTKIPSVFGFSVLVPTQATKVMQSNAGFGLSNSVAFKGSTVAEYVSSFGLSTALTTSMTQAEGFQVFLLSASAKILPEHATQTNNSFAIFVSNKVETEPSAMNVPLGLGGSAVIDSVELISIKNSLGLGTEIDTSWIQTQLKNTSFGLHQEIGIDQDDNAQCEADFGLLAHVIAKAHRMCEANSSMGLRPIVEFVTDDNRQAVMFGLSGDLTVAGLNTVDNVKCKYGLSIQEVVDHLTNSGVKTNGLFGLASTGDVSADDSPVLPCQEEKQDKSRWDV